MFKKKKLNIDRLKLDAKPAYKPSKLFAAQKKQVPRREDRTSTWQRCTIAFGGEHEINAIIMNYSKTGARVRFRSHEVLLSEVRLKSSALGIDARMRVAWQHKGDAGLRRI